MATTKPISADSVLKLFDRVQSLEKSLGDKCKLPQIGVRMQNIYSLIGILAEQIHIVTSLADVKVPDSIPAGDKSPDNVTS